MKGGGGSQINLPEKTAFKTTSFTRVKSKVFRSVNGGCPNCLNKVFKMTC